MAKDNNKINVEELNSAIVQILSKFGFDSVAIASKDE